MPPKRCAACPLQQPRLGQPPALHSLGPAHRSTGGHWSIPSSGSFRYHLSAACGPPRCTAPQAGPRAGVEDPLHHQPKTPAPTGYGNASFNFYHHSVILILLCMYTVQLVAVENLYQMCIVYKCSSYTLLLLELMKGYPKTNGDLGLVLYYTRQNRWSKWLVVFEFKTLVITCVVWLSMRNTRQPIPFSRRRI